MSCGDDGQKLDGPSIAGDFEALPEDSTVATPEAAPAVLLTSEERIFVLCISLTIFASSWLLGGRYLWAQWTMLGLCGASFCSGILVFFAQRIRRERSLGRWNGWWLAGLAAIGFAAFVGIQAVNISYLDEIGNNVCILTPIKHVAQLPSSISGSFSGLAYGLIEMENASRYLLIYGAAVLGGLALILGVQSPRCLNILWKVLLAHGILSALICIAHQSSDSTKVLWICGDPLAFLGAPFFFNKNQNAAYQTLLSGVLLYFAARCMVSTKAFARLSGVVLFALAELGLVSIRSRAGMVFAVVLGAVWLFQQRGLVARSWRFRRPAMLSVLSVLIAATGFVLWKAGGFKTLQRFGDERPTVGVVLHGGKYRQLLHEIALEMFKDRPWYGWGAACYFYKYSQYESRVPEMAANRPGFSYYLMVGRADGDWYEFLAEFGIVGTSIFAAFWLPHLVLWTRRRIWREPLLLAALPVALILLHGFIDTSFRNVGLLFLHFAVAILVSKMVLVPQREKEGRSSDRLPA